jgi:hypothetical protein
MTTGKAVSGSSRRYRCRIPAAAARHGEDIDITTSAANEVDMRHALRCWFGRIASEEASVLELVATETAPVRSAQPTP